MFALDQVQMGYVFSLGVFGMLFVAFFGGRIADYLGQKRVLMLSVAIFGVFFALTAIAPSIEILYAARFLTGLGLGAAMPTMISIVGDEATERNRGKLNSLMYCGLPVGAIFVAGMRRSAASSNDWWEAPGYQELKSALPEDLVEDFRQVATDDAA